MLKKVAKSMQKWKINEHWYKNRLGADFGLQNIASGGFWSDAKILQIFDTFLEA